MDTKPKRRFFIEEIKNRIASNCPLSPEITHKIIERWESDCAPVNLNERAIFDMCDYVARDLDESNEKGGAV